MIAPKPHRLLLASMGLGALGLLLSAAGGPVAAELRDHRMAPAEALRGTPVVDRSGAELGSVVDVVSLGPDGVRVAVLSSRGVPGLGEGLYPVPIDALRVADTTVEPTPARDVEPADRWPGEPEPSGLLGLKAENLIGQDVYSETGEPVARIEDVVVIDSAGVYLVLSVGGFLGVAGEEVALPIERFELRIDEVVLTRPITEDELEAMAPYRPEEGETVPRERTLAEVMAAIGGPPGVTAPEAAGPAGRGDELNGEPLVLDMDRERLNHAPRLVMTGPVPLAAEPEWRDRVLAYYQDLLPGGTAPRITGGREPGSSPSNQ